MEPGEIADRMENRIYHSRSYHEFFEGYIEKEIMDGKRRKLRRIYAGDYYVPEHLKYDKQELLFLFFIAVFFFITAGVQRISANGFCGIAFLEASALFLIFLSLRPLLIILVSPEIYTVRVYRLRSEKLVRYTKIISILCMAAAVLMLVYGAFEFLRGICDQTGMTAACALAEALSGILFWDIARMERMRFYQKNPGPTLRAADNTENF